MLLLRLTFTIVKYVFLILRIIVMKNVYLQTETLNLPNHPSVR
jgi:hypothetical protein